MATPEQYGVMSQNALASDESLLQGGSGATPTMIAEGADSVDNDRGGQQYFIAQGYTTANTPGWTY